MKILNELSALPHRGAATQHGAEAARMLQTHLSDLAATVRKEPFQTPKTYATIVYWLLGGLLTGLALIPVTGVAIGLVFYFIWLSCLYFNWRYSFIVKFPVQHTAHNIIGNWPARGPLENRQKVILMAHYDTAPISLFFGSNRQANVRSSVIIMLSLMLLAGVAALAEVSGAGSPYITYLRYGLMACFAGMAVAGTAGYWLKGYANGASDNATGVAAALATADRLRLLNLPDLDVEVVLTSAKEAGLIGAHTYVEAHKRKWNRAQTMAINFDTLGAGKLTVVEKSGTIETIHYDNEPTRIARQLLETDAFRNRAQVGQWHAADFDSVWFVRNKMPVLALCAVDTTGEMPRIHQSDDTLSHVDLAPVDAAIDLAEAVVTRWMMSRRKQPEISNVQP